MDTSYLAQQVTTIIGQLHTLFDEIGVPHKERDSRESQLFSSLSETLQNHLRQVTSEKDELIEAVQRYTAAIRQMEASLNDTPSNGDTINHEEDFRITYPLTECLRVVMDKHASVQVLYQERYEQIEKLVEALRSYSSHLEPSFVQIELPPINLAKTAQPTFDVSPGYITSVDNEFARVYQEYERRVAAVQQTAQEMIKLWAELGTPQAQTDTTIIHNWRDYPEQLGLHQKDVDNLRSRKEKLIEEKRQREKRLKDLKSTVEGLWDRLGIDEQERKTFENRNRGCGLRAINELEDELSRLNELKRQNLHLFVEDARSKLHILWDELYLSEEEAVEFTPMFCDVYSDALLSAHESEILRLETLKEQRAPILQTIARHRSLIKDREDLVASSQDASRLMLKPQKGEKRDPTRLLREEKMRKRIAKDLPKVEVELTKVLEDWEEEYGRPFLVFGERYLDEIESESAKAPPPRSKTPNGLPARSKTPNALVPSAPSTQPRAMKPAQPASRTGTMREAPTMRSRTPAPTLASATTNASSRSPSRLPSRVPLSRVSNSPERQPRQDGTLRKNAAPLMAPPPKLREFHPVATSSAPPTTDFSRSSSVVRHVPPEDPYSEHRQAPNSYLDSSVLRAYERAQSTIRTMPPPPRPNYRHEYQDHSDNASVISGRSRPISSTAASSIAARHISATSSNATHDTVYSGSENWETYDDDESLATEAPAPPPQVRHVMRSILEPASEDDMHEEHYTNKLRPPNTKQFVENNNSHLENGAAIGEECPATQAAKKMRLAAAGFTGVMGRVQQGMQPPPTRFPMIARTPPNDDECY